MSAELPVRSVLLWSRWLAAMALVVWLPGHLLVGRHLRALDEVSRATLALAAGLALTVVAAPLAAVLGVPWRPLPYLVFALAAGWGTGRAAGYRRAIAAWTGDFPTLPAAGRWLLFVTVLLGGWLLIAGYGALAAPPHVHDASNHAFLVQRVVESGRADARSVFAGLYGRPDLLYLPGWHATAALVASASGVAPYVSAWFFPLMLAALLPVSISVAWRSWGLPPLVVACGALLLTGNTLVPGGILEWGGFGQIAGLFCLPAMLVAVRGLRRRPGVWTGLWCGVIWAALARAHAGEAFAAVVLGALTWSRAPGRDEGIGGGRLILAIGVTVLALAALIAPDAWRLGGAYAGTIVHRVSEPAERFGYALEKYWKAGGRAPGLQLLTAFGMVIALAGRRWRFLALVSLALGAVFVARAAWRDPLTGLLTVPFYGQAPRVLYLQCLFLPAIAALPLATLWQWLGRRRIPSRAVSGRPAWTAQIGRAGVLAVALLLALGPAWPQVLRQHRLDRGTVPFTPAEYALARQIADAVPAGAVIANYWDDGSTWASQVSGRAFLQPLSWALHGPAGQDLREATLALRERPWPPAATALRDAGVQYLYVSDRQFPPDAPLRVERAEFDGDDRFAPVLRGGAAALYRILWDAAGPATAGADTAPSR
ncbi:MAG TPA: hypothetical protein PLL30_08640 [Candidatus Krumholzibacteria bacterium]|nr:hypothetical protein [Candidatus Krumholzibacteria bacterium]HPD71826.1 hypothetical protein [Candidatus Krumholzibacteria bacterium]HRY41241.1 hypothetical protein [Candidatus Krumholzibacteria bacterium]